MTYQGVFQKKYILQGVTQKKYFTGRKTKKTYITRDKTLLTLLYFSLSKYNNPLVFCFTFKCLRSAFQLAKTILTSQNYV